MPSTDHPAANRELEIVHRAHAQADRPAVVDDTGSYRYRDLLEASHAIASALLEGRTDLQEARVAYLCMPGFDYVASQWGIWRAGGIAVPLALSHPEAELRYCIEQSDASVVIADPSLLSRVERLATSHRLSLLTPAEARRTVRGSLPFVATNRRAIIFYTSGTTGRPKGAVWCHETLSNQASVLTSAWRWSPTDRIVSVLPLHHVHGVLNVLTCALWNGACCELPPRFDARLTWDRIAAGGLTLFMAVPTIYVKLIRAWEEAPAEVREVRSQGCRGLRLMVSGSAALPVDVLERWRRISGHVLLERYGMTEIGMALSNPIDGERVPGSVGSPLAGVDVRLVDETGSPTLEGEPGEIEVRGPGLFLEYWGDPEATATAFRDGWFRTGDVAVIEHGRYRILGRQNVDIIKTGGFKVSALEIEEILRACPGVHDCAVVGLADREWGELVVAVVVAGEGAELSPDGVRAWASERLARYKVPSRVELVTRLPRNAMGKVVKADLRASLERGDMG
jgi:malonyl-CoA/methylmalonyl-CoA synthetase